MTFNFAPNPNQKLVARPHFQLLVGQGQFS